MATSPADCTAEAHPPAWSVGSCWQYMTSFGICHKGTYQLLRSRTSFDRMHSGLGWSQVPNTIQITAMVSNTHCYQSCSNIYIQECDHQHLLSSCTLCRHRDQSETLRHSVDPIYLQRAEVLLNSDRKAQQKHLCNYTVCIFQTNSHKQMHIIFQRMSPNTDNLNMLLQISQIYTEVTGIKQKPQMPYVHMYSAMLISFTGNVNMTWSPNHLEKRITINGGQLHSITHHQYSFQACVKSYGWHYALE